MSKKPHRKWQQRLSVMICLALWSGVYGTAYGGGEAFKTPEYYAGKGLELINAANAYQLGYTGKGITLGICDDFVKFSHPEFVYKSNSVTLWDVPPNFRWSINNHGTHVGGTMAAAKDNIGMHGVAFDANLVSGMLDTDESVTYLKATYDGINQNSAIKIVNNSWGASVYIDELKEGKAPFDRFISPTIDILASSITGYDKVLVFAAGNAGHPTPGGESMLSYIRPRTAGNFLNVTIVHPANDTFATQTASTNFVTVFSDLTKYVEENSIAAPGDTIYSASAGDNGYTYMSGTSMAAPHVSGVAGLVQQAFPYMSGKQLVDTVLTTANSTFTLPSYTVTVQEDWQDNRMKYRVNLYYFGDIPKDDVIKQNLRKYYVQNEKRITKWYPYKSPDDFVKAVIADGSIYHNVPREMIFGQGLLDAGAAVRGPAILNARRMDSTGKNLAADYTKLNEALYAVDTQGYNSEWSNNITEKRAGLLDDKAGTPDDLRAIYKYYLQGDVLYGFTQGQDYINEYNANVQAKGLQNLPVGLIKQGQGILALTGMNTYTGSSVAAGGVLQIDGSVAGDAFSVEAGTIAGSGFIAGKLTNKSIVQAGSYNLAKNTFSPGTLTVSGDLASSGKIAVAAKDIDNYSKLKVTGTADIAGTSFTAVQGSIYQPEATYPEVLTAGNITGDFIKSSFTGLLSAEGTVSGDKKSAHLTLKQENNLLNPSARQQQMVGQINAMYNVLPQPERQTLDQLYSLSASQAAQALTAVYGGAQLNQAQLTQRDTTLSKAIGARMNYLKYTIDQPVTFKLPTFAPGSYEVMTVVPLELDTKNSWWMKVIRNWGSSTEQSLPRLDNRSFSFVVGQDKKVNDNWRMGVLLGYGTNDINSTIAKTDSRSYQLGVYGGYNKGAVELQTFLGYGRQSNKATRYLQHLNLEASSKYDSNTLNFGITTRYNLQQNKDVLWKLSPYGSIQITRYSQEAYQESGAEQLSQQVDKLSNTYSTGEIGFEVGRDISSGHYGFRVGYKKVLSGSNPDMTIAFSGNPGQKLKISGTEQDHEYVVAGFSFQGKIGKDWSIDAQLDREMGSNSNFITASIMARKVW